MVGRRERDAFPTVLEGFPPVLYRLGEGQRVRELDGELPDFQIRSRRRLV